MKGYFAAVLALLCASVAVSSACFAAPDDPATRQVLYGDLDLSTPGGLKAIDRRIEGALNWVCLDPYGPSPAGVVDLSCKRGGRKAARQQLATAIALQQSGRWTVENRLSIRIPNSERKALVSR